MMEREAWIAKAVSAYPKAVFASTVNTGSVSLAAYAGGEGDPVILLHGWPMTSFAWRYVQPALIESGRRVIALDLPGMGKSGFTASYDTASVADIILKATDALGLSRFDLIGHDIGGMVAVSLALKVPDRVASLVCLETEIPGGSEWDHILSNPHLWHFHFHQTPKLPETLIEGRERDYVRFFYDRDASVQGALTEDELQAYAAAQTPVERLSAGLAYYRAFPESARRNRELLARGRLKVPVVAIDGRHSRGEAGANALKEIARDRHHLVLECGHFIPEEVPEALTPALLQFLSRPRSL